MISCLERISYLTSDVQNLNSAIVNKLNRKLTLAGVGVRVKHIGPIKAKVYSAAVYLDKGCLWS